MYIVKSAELTGLQTINLCIYIYIFTLHLHCVVMGVMIIKYGESISAMPGPPKWMVQFSTWDQPETWQFLYYGGGYPGVVADILKDGVLEYWIEYVFFF